MLPDMFLELLEDYPVIAAVKDRQGLECALKSECKVIFSLFGDILSIADITKQVKKSGKSVFLHVDLIDGLAVRDVSIDYVIKNTNADGIISTKSNLVRRAESCGLLAIQRFFMLDSMALDNIRRQFTNDTAVAIEILPGVIPKVISRIAKDSPKPIIAGGLIADKEDVVNALGAGACAVSSTNPDIWFL